MNVMNLLRTILVLCVGTSLVLCARTSLVLFGVVCDDDLIGVVCEDEIVWCCV